MSIKSRAFLIALILALLAGCAMEDKSEAAVSGEGPQRPSQAVETAAATEPSAPERKRPEEDKSYVFVERDTDGTDGGFARLTGRMEDAGLPFYATGAGGGIIGGGDVVIIKINAQWAERGGTNVDLLESVVEAIVSHPDGFTGEIIIADNGQAQYGTDGRGGSLRWPRTNAKDMVKSPLDVAAKYAGEHKVSGYLWDDIALTRVKEFADGDDDDGFVLGDEILPAGLEISYPKFTTAFGTRVSFRLGVWDEAAKRYDSESLKVINMPVLKRHSIYGVTGAVKSYMGVVADRLTGHRSHQSVGSGGMGAVMAGTRMPAITILDMIWTGTGRGPGTTYGAATETRMIAASADPVALDYWAAKNVLLPYVEERSRAGADPDGREDGSFGSWLARSAEELRSVRRVTADPAGIKVIGE